MWFCSGSKRNPFVTAHPSGCQHVASPASMHSRSFGRLSGSLERHRKPAVRSVAISSGAGDQPIRG
jgi:hypothetical protein